MYEAFNDRVIAVAVSEETKTASGIILNDDKSKYVKYLVCYTNDKTKQLQDRIVYAGKHLLNQTLPESGKNGEAYIPIPLEEIIAVKAHDK